jgi:hypothetical protein
MNMDDLMKEIDGAWPKGMPPEELDVCVVTEDQVILDIKGLTLQMINDKETVVIEFVPVNFDDITVDALDRMAEFIQKKKDALKERQNADLDKAKEAVEELAKPKTAKFKIEVP